MKFMNEDEATRIVRTAKELIDWQSRTISDLRAEVKYLQEKINKLEEE